jgi:hypothetical protein
VDLSNLKRFELYGLAAAALLILSLFLPWFDLTNEPQLRSEGDAWVCGAGNFECNAWDTFPILRWLFVAAALAPILLAYFIVTHQRGQYPTGEFTMTVGLAVIVLVGFNGILQKPGTGVEFGITLDYGYFLALLAGFGLAVAGALRSLESGGGAQRKPPATY